VDIRTTPDSNILRYSICRGYWKKTCSAAVGNAH